MHSRTAAAFRDELTKIAGFASTLVALLGEKKPTEREQQRVEHFFSPKAGGDKWDRFVRWTHSPGFVKQLKTHPESDEKLLLHALSMHQLQRGRPVGKVKSSTTPGKSYEIRKLPNGLGCTCPDWRFKGSVNPGYRCKHIRAHEKGKAKA
jgi:hypothetical protein